MSININGKATFSNVSISGIPQWQPPVGVPTIVAQLVYKEADGAPNSSYSTLAIEGNTIIANPTGTKIIYSTDLGENWTTTGNRPSEGGISKWQYYDGKWWVQLRPGNNDSYMASTVDGSSWTVGPVLYNDRYSSRSFHITETGDLIYGGRRPANDIIWTRYPTTYGASTIPTLWQDGPYNQNSSAMEPLSNGVWAGVWNSSTQYVSYWIASDMSTKSYNVSTNWGSTLGHYKSNNNDVVLIADNGTEVMRWKQEYATGTLPTLPLSQNTVSRGYTSLGWNDTIWMASTSSGNSTTWDLYHNDDKSAESGFTKGAILQLPSTQTSASSNAAFVNILPGPDNWWFGIYREQGDNRLVIIKWQYGSY